MKKICKPALFFVICLAIFIAINTPMALVLGRVKLPDNIIFYGVDGQLRSGQIDALYINQLPLRNIRYQADLSCLLILHICYQIDYQNGAARVSVNLLTNQTDINKLDVDYPLAALSPLMSQLLVKPTGRLNLQFDHIGINQNKIGPVQGVVKWRGAGIQGEKFNLGDYQLDIVREDNRYQVKLTDQGAMLGIDGKGSLKPDGQYLLDIKIVPKSSLDASVKSTLELVAKKQGLNQYNIQRQGQLPAPLLNRLAFSGN